MKKIFNTKTAADFFRFCEASKRILLVAHTNPDGDAIGSGLALLKYLRSAFLSKNIRFFVPNNLSKTLEYFDTDRDIEIYKDMIKEAEAFTAAADLIICLDFNQIHRLDTLSGAIEMNLHAPRILIDHHLDPPSSFDLTFHSINAPSTTFLIFHLIELLGGLSAITPQIAQLLYLGIITDTGNFNYSNLSSNLFIVASKLIESGANPSAILHQIYHTQSESRLKLTSHIISSNMILNYEKCAAYITLTQEEKDRFNFQIGDTEGTVNIPLSIEGINFCVMLIESNDGIKVSLRSQGSLDVNVISNNNYNGGGHKNAAGGKLYMSIEEAIELTERVIANL